MGRFLALCRPKGRLHGVQIGLFLELPDVLLIANPLVAKPVGHLSRFQSQNESDTPLMTGRSRSAPRARRSQRLMGKQPSKQKSYLRHSDAAALGQLFFGFLARVRVREVRIEVLVQHLRSLFAEVTPLASDRERGFIVKYLSFKLRKHVVSDYDSLV